MAETSTFNRRKFLQITGVVTGATATLGLVSISMAADGTASGRESGNRETGYSVNGQHPLSRGKMFFTNALEFAVLSEAAERIFPKDENGPGAKDLAVPFFIDNQLAGAWGHNLREYTAGPHFEGTPAQGYQTPLLRCDVFKQGLKVLNDTARERFSNDFPELAGERMDQILKDCEAGKLATSGYSSAFFFSLLKEAVLAGVYADPIYNGNNNMDGWRLKNYPGAQMAYTYLMMDENFVDMDPVSLAGML